MASCSAQVCGEKKVCEQKSVDLAMRLPRIPHNAIWDLGQGHSPHQEWSEVIVWDLNGLWTLRTFGNGCGDSSRLSNTKAIKKTKSSEKPQSLKLQPTDSHWWDLLVLLKTCEFTIGRYVAYIERKTKNLWNIFLFLFRSSRASLQYCGLRGFESLWPRGQGSDYQRRFFQFCLLPVWQEVGEKRLLSLGRTLGEASLDMQ